MLENSLTDSFDDFVRFFSTPTLNTYTYYQNTTNFPPMNIVIEKNKKFIEMEIALSGFSKEQIKIEAEDEILIVEAEKPEEKYENVTYIKHNLKSNKFSRTFEFPDNYFDFRNPIVTFKDGLLRIRIEKNPDLVSEKRQIEIK